MLRNQGKMLDLSYKIDGWILDNADQMYEDPVVRKNLLDLKLSDPKRQERLRKLLDAEDYPKGNRKEKFKLALKEYALHEMAYPKSRNLMNKKKLAILDCAHPTNDYNYRKNFVERSIAANIAYFNIDERRKIEGDLDIEKIYL